MEVLKQVQLIWLVSLEALVSLSDGSCKRVSRMCFSWAFVQSLSQSLIVAAKPPKIGADNGEKQRICTCTPTFILCLHTLATKYNTEPCNSAGFLNRALRGADLVKVAVKRAFQ